MTRAVVAPCRLLLVRVVTPAAVLPCLPVPVPRVTVAHYSSAVVAVQLHKVARSPSARLTALVVRRATYQSLVALPLAVIPVRCRSLPVLRRQAAVAMSLCLLARVLRSVALTWRCLLAPLPTPLALEAVCWLLAAQEVSVATCKSLAVRVLRVKEARYCSAVATVQRAVECACALVARLNYPEVPATVPRVVLCRCRAVLAKLVSAVLFQLRRATPRMVVVRWRSRLARHLLAQVDPLQLHVPLPTLLPKTLEP